MDDDGEIRSAGEARDALCAPPPQLRGRTFTFTFQSGQLLVLSFALAEIPLPRVLTPAERSIVKRVIAGDSNAVIAAARGTAVRTVANQMAGIFRKLGVSSRAELVHVLACRERQP